MQFVNATATGSLIAVGALPATKPAGLADGDVLLAAVGETVLQIITPPAGWTVVRSDDDAGLLTQVIYTHTVTDAASEPTDYTWTFAVAVAATVIIGAWRGGQPGLHTATVTGDDASSITLDLPNPMDGAWLITFAIGIRLAVIGAGGTWSISDGDTERTEFSNGAPVGLDVSAALNDSNRGLPAGALSRTATNSITQTEMILTGVLLIPSEGQPIALAASSGQEQAVASAPAGQGGTLSSLVTSPGKVVSGATWPGTRALAVSPLAASASLNLDECVGQRAATYTFTLIDGVTGQRLGELHPIRQPATISHDTTRTIKRDLRIALTASETSAVDPLRDRVLPYLHLGGIAYPLGRFMFTDPTTLTTTAGNPGSYALLDEMFLIDQQLDRGFASTQAVDTAVLALLAGMAAGGPTLSHHVHPLPLVDVRIDPSPYPAVGGWAIGTRRGQVLDALAAQGDYQTPWLDHRGHFRMIRTVDPDAVPAELDFDAGSRVLRDGIAQTSDLLSAPNRFIVVGNGGGSGEAEIVGSYDVPPNAPHSIANRGFVIPDTQNLQIASPAQAQAMARARGLQQTIFVRSEVETPPDPRHDSYQVIRWQGANWLELAWSLSCEEGASMRHTLRRGLR